MAQSPWIKVKVEACLRDWHQKTVMSHCEILGLGHQVVARFEFHAFRFNTGVGSYQGQDRQMMDRALLTESDFPKPPTKTIAYM